MELEHISETTQYLIFKLEGESYALNIAKIHEVLGYTKITNIPRMHEFMRGVINLRGNVVPIVDLRLKFGLSKIKKKKDTCIIIVEIVVEGETFILGALVDSVQEVLALNSSQLEPPPKIGNRLRIEFIKGMGKWKDEIIIILDSDKIFSPEEFTNVLKIRRKTV